MAGGPAGCWRGLATAGWAVEGGYHRPGGPANQWAQWELAGLVPPSPPGPAFWDDPAALLDQVASAGCTAFGLSVEWARIEPEEGIVDAAALDRYAAVLEGCADRGLLPVVTLLRRTHPWWLGEEFWLTPGAPDRFAAHVARVVERLAGGCRHWVTVHEPNLAAAAGWVIATEPPARVGALSDAWAVCDNLLTAHVLAAEEVHRCQPDAQVTLSPRASSVYDLHALLVDLLCARRLGVGAHEVDELVAERRAVHDRSVPASGPAERLLRRAAAATSPFGGRRGVRRPSPRRVVDAVYAAHRPCSLDAVAVSWQQPDPTRLFRVPAGTRVGRGPAGPWVRRPWTVRPDPAALGRWCAVQAAATPGLPLWVLDDGLALPPDGSARPDGWDTDGYTRAHLGALDGAAVAGAPVAGYLQRADGYEPAGGRRDPAAMAVTCAPAATRT